MSNKRHKKEVLAAHIEELTHPGTTIEHVEITEEDRSELAPLFNLAEQIQSSMHPVRPPSRFINSLGQEITHNARQYVDLARRMQENIAANTALIALVLLLAALVSTIVFLLQRDR